MNVKKNIFFFEQEYLLILHISLICMKFQIQVNEGQMEGSMSKNCFFFMKSRKKVLKNVKKVTRFFTLN